MINYILLNPFRYERPLKNFGQKWVPKIGPKFSIRWPPTEISDEPRNHIQNYRFVRNFGRRLSDREFWAYFWNLFLTKIFEWTLVMKKVKDLRFWKNPGEKIKKIRRKGIFSSVQQIVNSIIASRSLTHVVFGWRMNVEQTHKKQLRKKSKGAKYREDFNVATSVTEFSSEFKWNFI